MTAWLIKLLNSSVAAQSKIAFAVLFMTGLVPLLAVFYAIQMLNQAFAEIDLRRDQISQAETRIMAMQGAIEHHGELKNLLQQFLLADENDAIASASLQSWISALAGEKNMQIHSVADAGRIIVNDIEMLGVKASLSGKYEDVIALLTSIEEARPTQFIPDIRLDAQTAQASDEPVEIVANLTVAGIVRKAGKENRQ